MAMHDKAAGEAVFVLLSRGAGGGWAAEREVALRADCSVAIKIGGCLAPGGDAPPTTVGEFGELLDGTAQAPLCIGINDPQYFSTPAGCVEPFCNKDKGVFKKSGGGVNGRVIKRNGQKTIACLASDDAKPEWVCSGTVSGEHGARCWGCRHYENDSLRAMFHQYKQNNTAQKLGDAQKQSSRRPLASLEWTMGTQHDAFRARVKNIRESLLSQKSSGISDKAKRELNALQKAAEKAGHIQAFKKRDSEYIVNECLLNNHADAKGVLTELGKTKRRLAQNIKFLYHEQLRWVEENDPRQYRWHPTLIKFALAVYARSPSAYKIIQNSGLIRLPSGRTVTDYMNSFSPETGWQPSYLDKIKESAKAAGVFKTPGGMCAATLGLLYSHLRGSALTPPPNTCSKATS